MSSDILSSEDRQFFNQLDGIRCAVMNLRDSYEVLSENVDSPPNVRDIYALISMHLGDVLMMSREPEVGR